MPLPVINYAALPASGDQFQSGLAESIQNGFKMRYMPDMMKEQLRQAQLANALAQVQAQYAPQMTQAELEYKQQMPANLQAQTGLTQEQAKYFGPTAMSEMGLRGAQTKLANQQANMPFGGHFVPGIGGEIQGLEAVKIMYGEDSPQYQMAKKQFDLNNQSTQSRIDYQNVLAQTLPTRALTAPGKSIVEQSNVGAGLMPTGNQWGGQGQMQGQQQPMQGQQSPMQQGMPGQMQQPQPTQMPGAGSMGNAISQAIGQNQQVPQAPASPQELADQYALYRQKNVSDVDTRKRNLFATNIEKTLNNINIEDLTQYAGLKGGIEMKKQQGLASVGKQSPAYDKFQNSLTAADFLASQVRQFYGESIQPEMRQKLESLTNPGTWTNNPELAKQLFKQTKNILGQEMQTYRDALRSPSAYQGAGASQSSTPSSANIQQMAHEAIAKGADPQQVQMRIQQMLSGGGQ